jgi:hypothetical protein
LAQASKRLKEHERAVFKIIELRKHTDKTDMNKKNQIHTSISKPFKIYFHAVKRIHEKPKETLALYPLPPLFMKGTRSRTYQKKDKTVIVMICYFNHHHHPSPQAASCTESEA